MLQLDESFILPRHSHVVMHYLLILSSLSFLQSVRGLNANNIEVANSPWNVELASRASSIQLTPESTASKSGFPISVDERFFSGMLQTCSLIVEYKTNPFVLMFHLIVACLMTLFSEKFQSFQMFWHNDFTKLDYINV